ncbi:MAG: DUF4254 domain-containing protein [Elusimicrobia bacterium]|nr:DUF4254 domain-containing protein [Elusimicrobiota bacterium]
MAETIGSLVDKISIIQLKICHMAEQFQRPDADAAHKNEAGSRLAVLNVQKTDLEAELTGLFKSVIAGRTRLKIYRQFKMYNDPRYRIR